MRVRGLTPALACAFGFAPPTQRSGACARLVVLVWNAWGEQDEGRISRGERALGEPCAAVRYEATGAPLRVSLITSWVRVAVKVHEAF